ncbi:MAG: hypothetical protein C4320_08060, partial [Armatimonadota bacterium]
AGQASVQVRALEVPRMTDAELRDHMQWEINNSIPFSETTIQSDYRKIPDTDPNSPNMEVVMAMAPQSAIDTVIECVRKAGKKPVAIDVEPLSLGRSLVTSYVSESNRGAVCMVDMGRSTSAINIYDNGNLISPRQVPIGGELFTRAIADALGMSMPDAEAHKLTYLQIPEGASASDNATAFGGYDYGQFDPNAGFGEPTQAMAAVPDPLNPYGAPASTNYAAGANDLAINPITGLPITNGGDVSFDPYEANSDLDSSAAEDVAVAPEPIAPAPIVAAANDPAFDAILPVLDEFVAELRRSIEYFQGRGGSITSIFLLGGGTQLKGMDGYIERSLGIETRGYDPLRGLAITAKRLEAGLVENHRQEMTVAIGNGLYILFD